jgi:hypothetical protein
MPARRPTSYDASAAAQPGGRAFRGNNESDALPPLRDALLTHDSHSVHLADLISNLDADYRVVDL